VTTTVEPEAPESGMPAPEGTGTQERRQASVDNVNSADDTIGDNTRAVADKLREAGFHVFPVDHPNHAQCIGKHAACDGQRGKHPAVSWGVWATTVTQQMIDMEWDKRGGLANIGISCGPSGLVVFDEDAEGELTRWTVSCGLDLPDTYQVTTGRGTHYYYLWNHATQGRIGNTPKIVEGFDVDIRGEGGFIVAEGSQHASGAVYTGNGKPIAPLPDKVAEFLLEANTKQSPASTINGAGDKTFWDDGRPRNVNDDPIRFHERHIQLVAYAGRLRSKGMDYEEAETLFRQRWLLCEQPTGQIPEAKYHGTPPADCNYPVTWKEAKEKLDDVYRRYPAGDIGNERDIPRAGTLIGNTAHDLPRLWHATDLKPAAPPRWLAKGRLPLAAISLLVGDEGIGKSLLWVLIAGAVTTGKALPAFGIPARDPSRILLVCTEDDWTTTVRPRLDVAGADLSMVDVICIEDDGSGAPVFPRDLHLISHAGTTWALIVVDAWLDTVAAGLSVRDPQQARQALHPWKEIASATDAAVLLLTHTNRVASTNPRDRYGATGELRKKARMTLFAQADEDGHLVVGPEKTNTAAPIPATVFSITAVQHFPPSEDNDGTVPILTYVGESEMTAREHLAATAEVGGDEPGGNPARSFVHSYLMKEGGEALAFDVLKAGRGSGFGDQELKDARRRHRNPRIESRKSSFGDGWVWAIALDEGGIELPQGGVGGGPGGTSLSVPPTPPSGGAVPPSVASVPKSAPPKTDEPVSRVGSVAADPTDPTGDFAEGIARFIKEVCTLGTGNLAESQAVFKCYLQWAVANNEPLVNVEQFRLAAKAAGVISGPQGVNGEVYDLTVRTALLPPSPRAR